MCDSPDITPVLAYLYNVTGSSGQECEEKKAGEVWVVGDPTQPRQHDEVGEGERGDPGSESYSANITGQPATEADQQLC